MPELESSGQREGRDDFPDKVKRAIADRVGLLCSNPDCRRTTKGPHTDDDKARNIGKACHIHAAARGGPRYDEKQTPEERKSAANGIWLCSNHAWEVDADELRFPAELLKRWKAEAEREANLRLQSPDAASSVAVLLAAADELLTWPQELPNGTWVTRPELEDLQAAVEDSDAGVTALLGAPGSGKSALLARLGCELRASGWNVVAIKADRLPASVISASVLAEHFGLKMPVSRAVYALSQAGKTVVLIDQMDALSDLADARTERLSVLLSLIASIRASGIPIVCSVRQFDFEHDTRFSYLQARKVALEPLADHEVDAVVRTAGFDPARTTPKLRSLLAIPYWLKSFVRLSWDVGPLPATSQALLEAVWQQSVLSPAAVALENERALSYIAEAISDEEELWVPRARFVHLEAAIQRLLAAGILAADRTAFRLSFAHQSLYEFGRARSFVGDQRLAAYVLGRQGSLFIRPTLWTALHYLRAMNARQYENELRDLWDGVGRAHIRLLLIEFIGQVDGPFDFEQQLIQPLFYDPRWSRSTFNAIRRSPEWLGEFRRKVLPRVIRSPSPEVAYAAVVGSLLVARDETLSLLARYTDTREAAALVMSVLRQLEDWTDAARDLLDAALSTLPDQHALDLFGWKLKDKAPGHAIHLIARYLGRAFDVTEKTLPFSEPLSPDAPDSERIAWHMHREPAGTIRTVFHDASVFHVLPELSAAAPKEFLEELLPWTARVLGYVADSAMDSSYRIDYIYDASRDEHPSRDLPHALRDASESWARFDAVSFLNFVTQWSQSELHTVHVVLSYGLELLGQEYPHEVASYLLGDHRRFHLGDVTEVGDRTFALLRSIHAAVSANDGRALENAACGYSARPIDAGWPVDVRTRVHRSNREYRLRLLQALPLQLLSTEARTLVDQEARAFGEEHERSEIVTRIRRIESPMSAQQMQGARNEHILGLFEELPDETGYRHPKRMLQGGAFEAGREFASFSKHAPGRAIAIIDRLAPERNEVPVAAAIGALAETGLSTVELCELILRSSARGFSSEDFRSEAARTLGKRAERGDVLPEAAVDVLLAWLAGVPEGPRTTARLSPGDKSSKPPFLSGHGGAFSLPGGSYAILDALTIAFLRGTPPRATEWLAMLTAHVQRDEDPLVWMAFSRRLEYLRLCDSSAATNFLGELLNRYPEILECDHGVRLLAQVSWWADPNATRRWISIPSTGSWEHADAAVGELTAFLATRWPAVPWAEQDLSQITDASISLEKAVGASHMLMHFWRDPAARERVCPFLCALAGWGEAAIDKVLLDRLAFDDLGPDDLSFELLKAFHERGVAVPVSSAHDAVSWIAKLVRLAPTEAYELLAGLVSAAESSSDPSSVLGSAALELVNAALTLQRVPNMREQGLSLFERLLALDLYGVRDALNEIDSARR